MDLASLVLDVDGKAAAPAALVEVGMNPPPAITPEETLLDTRVTDVRVNEVVEVAMLDGVEGDAVVLVLWELADVAAAKD